MQVVAAIPARLESRRLPRKLLIEIGGKPLIEHVWLRCQAARAVRETVIVTDAAEIVEVAHRLGARVLTSSSRPQNGTERIAEVLDRLEAPYIINVQGDEPLLAPETLDAVARALEHKQTDVVTPVFRLAGTAELANPHVVKVARASTGEALYFSRAPIPYVRGAAAGAIRANVHYGHVGIYGFPRHVLAAYPEMPASPLELCEGLEQLRLLENGITVHTIVVSDTPLAVNTPEDLAHVRRLMEDQR